MTIPLQLASLYDGQEVLIIMIIIQEISIAHNPDLKAGARCA